jgi:nitrate reductase delta subunit
MRRKHPRATWHDQQVAVTWQAASLLLGYPDERLVADLPMIRGASYELPDALGDPLRTVVGHLERRVLEELQADYVATFDTRRRNSLFLTYFAHGDTRKRGVALLRFKQAYLRSGFVLDADAGGELPDHLCVVLEFGATVDRRLGWGLLCDHRAGLELLRMSLRDEGSPWAGAVEAVSATLPALAGDERDAVRRLAAEGPPEEEVGLTPYATPGFDPGPAAPPGPAARTAPTGPQDLPMPTLSSTPGAR